jgi:hypothetical protein
MSLFNKKSTQPDNENNTGYDDMKSEILNRAISNMIASEDAESMIEGKKIVTAAISDAGVVLRLDDGTRFMYTCLAGQFDITLPNE